MPGEKDVTIAAFLTVNIRASEQSFKVILDDGGSSPRSGPCSVADAKLTAQLNDVSVPLIKRGGKIGESPGDDVSDNDCESPVLELDTPPPDGSSTLTLSDSSTTLICNVPDLKVARQATLMTPDSGTWTWRPGQAIAMQWSPSGDLRLWNLFTVDLLHLAAPNVIDDLVDIRDVIFEDDVLRFTVPPSVPPGSYILELSPSRTIACSSQRPFVHISSTLTGFGTNHPVTIVP